VVHDPDDGERDGGVGVVAGVEGSQSCFAIAAPLAGRGQEVVTEGKIPALLHARFEIVEHFEVVILERTQTGFLFHRAIIEFIMKGQHHWPG
jgi:hypothetical protein